MAQIIDGKKISQDIKDELKEKVTALKDTGTEVALAVIQVGTNYFNKDWNSFKTI